MKKNIQKNFMREVYIEIDPKGIITEIGENCERIFGASKQEVIGTNIKRYIGIRLDNISGPINIHERIKENNYLVDMFLEPIMNSKGDMVSIRGSIIKFPKATNLEGFKILNTTRDIIYRIDKYPEWKCQYLSSSIEEILGYTYEEGLNNPFLPLATIHPEDREYMLNKMNGNIDYSKPVQARHRHKDGHYIWLEDYPTPIYEDGMLVAFEGVSRDVTERRTIENKFKMLSYEDSLTGLYNKRFIDEEVEKLNTLDDTSVGVIFCDLDNMKYVNDNLGHLQGDKLLIYLATILKSISKDNSIVGRVGGDEFIVIIRDTILEEVESFYYNLIRSIERHNKFDDEVQVKVSIGYSFSPTTKNIIKDVIKIADENMYKVKRKKGM